MTEPRKISLMADDYVMRREGGPPMRVVVTCWGLNKSVIVEWKDNGCFKVETIPMSEIFKVDMDVDDQDFEFVNHDQFAVGDKVKLRSGGPVMEVTAVIFGHQNNILVSSIFTNRASSLAFPSDSLMKVPA